MNRRTILFFIITILIVTAIRRIPIELIFRKSFNEDDARNLKAIIVGIPIIAGCLILAQKKKLLDLGGFTGGNRKNYWMIIIPVIFPAAVFMPNSDFSCYSLSATACLFVISLLVKAMLEETLFRGLILGYVRKENPGRTEHFYCLITALMFSAVHFSNLQYYEAIGVIQQVIYAFYVGLLLSAIQLRISNVWLLGFVHGLMNFMTTNYCKTQTVNENETSSFADYLIAAGSGILIFSPVLLIYFLLLNNSKGKSFGNSKDP